MTGLLIALALLLLVGDGPTASSKGSDNDDNDLGNGGGDGNDDGGAVDDGGDTKCPAGAPLIYTGPMFDFSEYSHLNEVTENLITPTERSVMLYVIEKAADDDGFPSPAAGACLQEDLAKYLGVPPAWPNLGSRGWPALLAMTAWSRANMPLSEPRKWDTLTAAERKTVEVMANYIKAREDNENAENDPGEPPTTSKPQKGAYYLVKSGNTLLQLAGAASGYGAGTVGRREYAKRTTLDPRNAGIRVAAKAGSFDAKYLGGYTLVLKTGSKLFMPT